jgi:F-type H+-transporting ATPase subunit b
MNINITLFAVAAAFAVFIWFTAHFIWPLLMNKIEERQKRIADGLAAADEGKHVLVEAERRSSALLGEARDRAQAVVLDSERRAGQILEAAKANAKGEAERILASAQEQIHQEIAKAKGQLREQVASLAVSGAEKILQREVNASAHADMLNRLKAQL